jgi:hypothetical protein
VEVFMRVRQRIGVALSFLIALALLAGAAGQGRAEPMTYWNMKKDHFAGVTDFRIDADARTATPGTITSNYQGSDVGAVKGTKLNAAFHDRSSKALALFDNGDLGTNGLAEEFTASTQPTAVLGNLTFSFAVRKQSKDTTGTGVVEVSTDGVTFTLLGTYTATTAYQVDAFTFSNPHTPEVYVRVSPDQTGSEGFVAFDNVRFDDPPADPVPEPASLTLLGVGAAGLLGYGWRKRKWAAA